MTLGVEIAHRFGAFSLDIAFEVGDAGITALFGPSGSGKSTTVNAVAGLLRPERGRITINGRTVFDAAAGVHLDARARRVGYVFQDGRLFPHLSVQRNLLYGWRRASRRAPDREIGEVVDLLGIGALLDRRPWSLSGGERQRVAIGRALLSDPAVLLLDEPLAALDYKRRAEILPYLDQLRRSRRLPMLYVSHAIDEVTRLADTVQVIDRGRIVASGSVAEVFSRVDLFPVTGRFEAGAVIDARIVDHDLGYGLTRLAFVGGELVAPEIAGQPGEPVRARIRSRDIMLSANAPTDISANNVLHGRIAGIRTDSSAYADVQVVVGEAHLIARITRLSLDRLRLHDGLEIYAIVKTVTID